MTEYQLPAGYGTAEHVEKKSRFIATTLPISSQEEALEFIEKTKKLEEVLKTNKRVLTSISQKKSETKLLNLQNKRLIKRI